LDDEEKKLTAFHEAGHALVQAMLDDGMMPVHKVTIIPRVGRSLGSTMFIPKKDILNACEKQRYCSNQIAMGFGRPDRGGDGCWMTSRAVAAGDIKQNH